MIMKPMLYFIDYLQNNSRCRIRIRMFYVKTYFECSIMNLDSKITKTLSYCLYVMRRVRKSGNKHITRLM
jgi:hypothetical protein